MPNESDKSISRLADALLVAEAAYQRARDLHERERSALSQRLLIEARHRLEYLESCAFELSADEPAKEPTTNQCPQCGGDLHIERWSALARTTHQTQVDGSRVTMVRTIPDWAVDHAMRGTAMVSRHCCRNCDTQLSISTGVVD